MAIELANHIYRDGEGVPVVLMNAYPVDHRMPMAIPPSRRLLNSSRP